MKKITFVLFALFITVLMQAQPTHEFQRIYATDGQSDDMFGYSLAIWGNFAIFGTPQDDDIESNSGAAYIYERTGADWNVKQKLTISTAEAADMFGEAVDIDSNYLVVSAYQAAGITGNTGVAYVYKKNGTSWFFQDTIYANDGETADNFGKSIAISGDYIVVGADNEDFGSGSAYVFHRNDTIWEQVAKLEGDDSLNDYFAHSVDIDGDKIVVGAWQSNAPGSNTGSAFVFKNNGGVWELDTQLVAKDAAVDDGLGYSVAISGDYIVAGAHGSNLSTGAAYVFYNDAGTWKQQAKLVANNGGYEDYFGKNVSISGNYILVGAQRYDYAKSDEGTVYLFVRTGTDWARQTQFFASDTSDTGIYGYCTAIDGDFAFVSSIQTNGTVYALGPDNVSLKSFNNKNISVYPNPTSDFIRINTNNLVIKNIEILDLNGKILFNQNTAQSIDISDLEAGVYILKIKTNQSVYCQKIIKK